MSAVALSPAPGRFALTSVPTSVLVRELDTLAAQELITDADVLAHLAELDVREEYLQLGFPSMHEYCIRRLRMSEDRANKRIRACRAALEHPVIFAMIADGRLNLGSVLMLASHLDASNAAELLQAAAGKTRVELEFLLAARFPAPGLVGLANAPELRLEVGGNSGNEVAPGPVPVPSLAANHSNSTGPLPATATATENHAPSPRPSLYAKFKPLSADCVAIEGRLSMQAHEHFQRVRALASHAVPSGNAALVIEYALRLAAKLLDRQKFGKGVRTRPSHGEQNGRYVPAAFRQAVCERDGGRCTFTAADGTRCGCETHLELDHIEPLAKGGKTTVQNLRLLCARHNRVEAKREFGAARIEARIEQARAEAVRARQRKTMRDSASAPQTAAPESRSESPEAIEAAARQQATPAAPTRRPASRAQQAPDPVEADVISALRGLRFTLAEVCRGVELTAHMAGATAEARVRVALQHLSRVHAQRIKPALCD